MLKYFSILSLTIVLMSCGGNGPSLPPERDVPNQNVGAEKYPEGAKVYQSNCVACHQDDGTGIAGSFPPLANSDYLLADKNRAIRQIVNGSNEKMVVNGVTYESNMPAQNLNNQQVVDVMNYILNQWGNDGGEVSLADVENALSEN